MLLHNSSATPSVDSAPPTAVARLGWFRALVALEVLVALAVGVALAVLRSQTVDGELGMLSALARAMALQADRTLAEADGVLRMTQDELAHGLVVPGTADGDAELRQRLQPLDAFRSLDLYAADGRCLASTRGVSSCAADAELARRAAAEVPMAEGLQLLPPEDESVDAALIVLRREPSAAAGDVAVLALRAAPGVLAGGYERIAPTADTHLAVLQPDGRPLSRHGPGALAPAPAMAALAPMLAAQPAAPATEFSPSDGAPVLLAAAPVQRHPLVVVAWRDASAALAEWRDAVWLVGLFAASMLGVTLLLGWRTARERLRRERLEQQLERARKLEALGQLAGGVAHDFNNVLAAVVGYAEMARQALPDDAAPARHLDQVLQAGQRGRQLVSRILSFSRGQPRREVHHAPQPVVAEVLDHLAGVIATTVARPEALRVERRLDAADLQVRGEPTALYEAVLNLCTNAVQAMPDGGALTVTLRPQTLDAPRALYDRTLPPGGYVRLEVADTGGGIPPEVMPRLFEPFFTTRGGRGGTGLGLAVVHAFVREAGGGIDVQTAPGQGTRFSLWLPCEAAAAAPSPTLDAAPSVPEGAGQTVLVVDDEPALVALTEDLLAGLGYEPLGLGSAERALEEFQRDPARFDLLLTDEAMPGMSGMALAAAVHAIRPELPVVVVTGYGGPAFDARAGAAGVRIVVPKPLQRHELAAAVARALQGHDVSRARP